MRYYHPALALLCACMLLTGAASSGRMDVEDMLMMDRFRAWQATYNRSYATATERMRRFEVYRQNMELIEATNRRGGLSYKLGETPFTDLTSEEFLATHTIPRLPVTEAAAGQRELITTRAGPISDSGRRHWNYTTVTDVDVPESVDWRNEDAVTPVKDQGPYGTCWAFAAVASIEGLHKIKTGKLVSLSEQQLVDCLALPIKRRNPARAMDWVVDNGGITTESNYPYKGQRGECETNKLGNHAASIRGRTLVNRNQEEALEAAVAQNPVAVLVNAGPLNQHYNTGVFNEPCNPDEKLLNHAVTVVGYGADDNGKYWIVKNSWGKYWGEKGYIRLARRIEDSRGTCGIAEWAYYPVM